MQKIKYMQLRQIIAEVLQNPALETALKKVQETGLLALPELVKLVSETGADLTILKALADKPVEELDDDEAAELLNHFFTRIKASWQKCTSLPASLA